MNTAYDASPYSLDAGRAINRDNADGISQPFIAIQRSGETAPTDADSVAHIITHLLNLLDRAEQRSRACGNESKTLRDYCDADAITCALGTYLR